MRDLSLSGGDGAGRPGFLTLLKPIERNQSPETWRKREQDRPLQRSNWAASFITNPCLEEVTFSAALLVN